MRDKAGQARLSFLAEAERAAALAREVHDPFVRKSWEKIAATYREMAQQDAPESAFPSG